MPKRILLGQNTIIVKDLLKRLCTSFEWRNDETQRFSKTGTLSSLQNPQWYNNQCYLNLSTLDMHNTIRQIWAAHINNLTKTHLLIISCLNSFK